MGKPLMVPGDFARELVYGMAPAAWQTLIEADIDDTDAPTLATDGTAVEGPLYELFLHVVRDGGTNFDYTIWGYIESAWVAIITADDETTATFLKPLAYNDATNPFPPNVARLAVTIDATEGTPTSVDADLYVPKRV